LKHTNNTNDVNSVLEILKITEFESPFQLYASTILKTANAGTPLWGLAKAE